MSERSERVIEHRAHAMARNEHARERSERVIEHRAHAMARNEP